MDGWSLMLWCIAAATAILGILWIDRSIRRVLRRTGTSPTHCPMCAYDLAGLEDCLCPECGMDTRGSHISARVRGVMRAAAPGIALLVIAGAAGVTPTVMRNGVLSLVPTTGLIVMIPWAPGEATSLHQELGGRIRAGKLSAAQGLLLASRCAVVIAEHADASRRAGAAEVLAASPDESESTALAIANAMKHPDEAVRLAVLPACAARARAHRVVAESLIGAVADDASELARARAVDALRRSGRLNRTATAVLAVAATSDSARVRQRAVYAIGASNPMWNRSADVLARAVNDDDAGVREAALAVLRNRAECDSGAVQLLTDGLADPLSELRIWTATQLPFLGAAALKAIPALLAATTDRDGDVRAAAGDAVATILRQHAAAQRVG